VWHWRQAIPADTVEARKLLVARLLPPLSEIYRADLVPDTETLLEEYAERGVGPVAPMSIFARHCLPCAEVSVKLCVATGKPTWASFTLKRERSSGTKPGSGVYL